MLTIFNDYKKVNTEAGTVVAIGNFDGLHKGHKKLLEVLKKVSYEKGVPSVVYTFTEHPINIIKGDNFQKLIYSNKVKEELIGQAGVHTLFFEDFKRVKELSCEEFVKEILVGKFNVKAAVIGSNGKFGKNSSGTADTLKELGRNFGFSVYVVDPVKVGETVCSSTEIRNKIEAGEVDKAETLLGRPYSVDGVVTSNKRMGRTYGYPTANIIPDKKIIRIKRGIYATNVIFLGKRYKAITNVGTTSFDDDDIYKIETHILDFNEDIYDKIIEIEFLYYMRDFKNFTSVDELKIQLDEDKKMRLWGN